MNKFFQCGGRGGFTLVELMVAVVILAMIMLLVANFTQQAGRTWKSSQARVESFQGARAGFEAMTRRLSQVTLNNYYAYDEPSAPTAYLRYSELHFISGKNLLAGQVTHAVFFQAPLGYSGQQQYEGMENLVNACGYYVEYGGDARRRPAFLGSQEERRRFRLMQFTQPTQELALYSYVIPNKPETKNWNTKDWFTGPLSASNPPVRVLAENIVALVILPKLSLGDAEFQQRNLAPTYDYDSRNREDKSTLHQLPPLLEVVMVAIDETSALRMGNTADVPAELGALNNLFQDSRNGRLAKDVQALEEALQGQRLNYRVFRSEVPVRTAKWSDD